MASTDEFHGVGGTYQVDPASGKRTLLKESTRDHPEGNRARDKDGKPVERGTGSRPALERPAEAQPPAGAPEKKPASASVPLRAVESEPASPTDSKKGGSK